MKIKRVENKNHYKDGEIYREEFIPYSKCINCGEQILFTGLRHNHSKCECGIEYGRESKYIFSIEKKREIEGEIRDFLLSQKSRTDEFNDIIVVIHVNVKDQFYITICHVYDDPEGDLWEDILLDNPEDPLLEKVKTMLL